MILTPLELYDNGFTDLVPVIPPAAPLAPSSNIPAGSLGKIPGRKNAAGTWGGFAWQKYVATRPDVEKWIADGANTGLRADRFPGLDVDVSDPELADLIQNLASTMLGNAECRTGRAPKRLLVYRTNEPMSRMRLWFEKDGVRQLVEVLGVGCQYVVCGTHPVTHNAYTWSGMPTPIVRDRTDFTKFFDELAKVLDMLGYDVSREGDGRVHAPTTATSQSALLAPSMTALREAVALTPNDLSDRDAWIRYGTAIRAACGDNIEEGFEIFSEFSARWTDGFNPPEVVRADWRRFKPPFRLGWGIIAEMARTHGFKDAALDFGVVEPSPEDTLPGAVKLSDGWLAAKIIEKRAGDVRYSDEAGRWFVWSGSMWTPDAVRQADHLINAELEKIADSIARTGATDAEKKRNAGEARMICNDGKSSAVRHRMESCPEIAIRLDSFDADPWVLCTPGGLVNLKTGELGPPDPDALTSKCTSVTPDATKTPHRWLQFLDEACGHDAEMVAYLQRWAGYCLTGSVREQALGFLLGPGGRGKSTYLNTLVSILKDYAVVSPLDTFTASKNDRHSTDVAGMEGARLVVSSENQTGKRFDEQRVKSLTGGERITARLMRKDNHTYKPTFKLLFAGNSAPTIRTADEAMKRRLQFIPFVTKPAAVDKELDQKLEAEAAGILAWAVAGCLEWQRLGLAPPPSVVAYTDKYFESEDSLGTFLRLRTVAGGWVGNDELFTAWRQWANGQNEYVGTAKSLAAAMSTREIPQKVTALGVAYEITLQPVDFSAF